MPYTALDAGNGLETSLFMALVAFVGAGLFMWKTRIGRLVTGVLIALAILTRPEGGFLLPAVAIYAWVDRPEGQKLVDYFIECRLALPAGRDRLHRARTSTRWRSATSSAAQRTPS